MSTSECIFCGMARDSSHPAPIYRDERVFVLRDINPKASTHLLIRLSRAPYLPTPASVPYVTSTEVPMEFR